MVLLVNKLFFSKLIILRLLIQLHLAIVLCPRMNKKFNRQISDGNICFLRQSHTKPLLLKFQHEKLTAQKTNIGVCGTKKANKFLFFLNYKENILKYFMQFAFKPIQEDSNYARNFAPSGAITIPHETPSPMFLPTMTT